MDHCRFVSPGVVWMSGRAWFGRWRLFFLTSLMAPCVFSGGWLLPSRYAVLQRRRFTSPLSAFSCSSSAAISGGPGHSDRGVRGPESSLVRRGATAGVTVLVVVCVLAGSSRPRPAAAGRRGSGILALFPYDGPFDPTRPARDVILRLADFNRLEPAGRDPSPAARLAGASGRSAVHRVTRKSVLDVVVESEIELTAAGRAPFAWEFPVSFAHDIQVTLDGDTPARSRSRREEPGATWCIPEAGNHLLRIRRSVAIENRRRPRDNQRSRQRDAVGSRGRRTREPTAGKTAS